jgi:hypothetical protein
MAQADRPGFLGRRSSTEIRAELAVKVRDAVESEADIEDLTESIVDVFAAALDEIHEGGGEIPDIKRPQRGNRPTA